MNFFRGVVSEDGTIVTESGAALPLPPGHAARPGSKVVAGITAEHLSVRNDGPIATKVVLVEHLGPETFAYMEGEQALLCVRLPREATLQRGSSVRLHVEPRDVHVFDPQTQQRLDQRAQS